MLYESMAWSYLFRKMGIPVPLRWNCVDSTLFSWDISEHPKSVKRLIDKVMKKIILYIAASLDQRIAEPDGNFEFLSNYPITKEMNYGYKDLLASVDTVIMGGRTYRELLNMDVIWPYPNQHTYVVSHNDWGTKENISFITENIIETISELRNQKGKDIWLVGGGELISMLLAANLIDEMQICYVPLILGKGISLFPEQPKESTWQVTGSKVYDSGILKVDYFRK